MRLSKAWYVGVYAAWLPLGILGGILTAVLQQNKGSQSILFVALNVVNIIVGAASAVCFVVGAVLWVVLFYKAWQAIQDGYARTTPGKAVGFLFIPFFLAYWMFQCIWGFAKDYNAYIERHGIDAKPLSSGFFLFNVIVRVCWIVPVLNYIAILLTFILNIPLMWMVCNAVNALPEGERTVEFSPVTA